MTLLPTGFEALQPFVAAWAIDGSVARARRRTGSTPQERQSFYDAMAPLLPAALARLDETPLDAHDESERTLMNLCLTAAHIALAVEALGEDEAKHAQHREQMHITRATADLQAG